MSDKPEKPRFSPAQLAIAGLAAAVALIIIVIANALWNSMPG